MKKQSTEQVDALKKLEKNIASMSLEEAMAAVQVIGTLQIMILEPSH